MGETRVRFASYILLGCFAASAGCKGCGDDWAVSEGGEGGMGGLGGTGGSPDGEAGTDGGSNPDANDGGGAGGTAQTGGQSGGGASGHAGTGGAAGMTDGGGKDASDGQAGVEGGPDASPACYNVMFTAPVTGTALTVANDKDMSCANGFQYDVKINTNAPSGTAAQLFQITGTGSQLLATDTVANGTAIFGAVVLPTGSVTLQIQFPSAMPCTDPSTKTTFTVTCPGNPPTCTISQPTISSTNHPALNGVLTPAGDRATQVGSPYKVTFQVTTNAEQGQPVSVAFTNSSVAGSPTSTVSTTVGAGGVATVDLPLAPDGTYQVIATCKNAAGVTGTSMGSNFPVDTTPPTLAVSKPTQSQYFPPGALTNGAFQVCAQTTSNDAAAANSGLGQKTNNICVSLGGAASCVASGTMAAVGADTCLNVPCPGGAPFDLNVTLQDAAGNPVTQTVRGVSCASMLPSVQIISPVSDAPSFSDQTRRILSSTATVGIKDQDPSSPGAQVDVVACADRNGTAALLGGHSGDVTLTQIGSSVMTVAAQPADNCPSGLGFVARFPAVTIPDSVENPDGTLKSATALSVTLVDAANSQVVGTSTPAVAVWVDTTPPMLAVNMPNPLCTRFELSATSPVNETLTFNTDASAVTISAKNGATTTTYNTPAIANGIATFTGVAFTTGQNDLTVVASDPAGNSTTLAPNPCSTTVGTAPVVTFTAPTAGQVLCPAGSASPGCVQDADNATAGWQGDIAVRITVDNGMPLTSGNVTFTIGATTLGVAALDSNGVASLTSVTLPNGAVTIVATTDNVPNRGVGTANVTVNVVDNLPPTAVTGLTVSVTDRRKTTMRLTWTAPNDSGAPVSGYAIRYAKTPIGTNNFDDATQTTAVTYTGTPASPGQLDGIDVTGLYIENSYHFAIAALDAAGNRGPITSTHPVNPCDCTLGSDGTSNCCAAHFNVTQINSPGGGSEQFGHGLSGEGDVNGDGLADLLVGTSSAGRAYLFIGANNFTASAPSVTFSGSASGFGFAVAQIGDVDNDGLGDVAIADALTNQRIYIYRGRTTWPLTLTDSQADYVITTDSSYVSSAFGSSMARLGDFTGDGVDDFAIGARGYGGGVGRVVIIPGKATGFGSVSLPDTTNAITIDGDSTLGRPFFGYRVLGLGHFYSVTAGTTLVVSSPGAASSATANAGRVYAFHSQSGTGGAIPVASADHVVVGPGAGARIGIVLTNLQTMLNGFPGIGIGNVQDTLDVPGARGDAYVRFGTSGTGPFSSASTVYQAGANGVGGILIGGGISGRDTRFSLVGDATPDLVLAGEIAPSLTILDGARIGAKSSPIEAGASAEVTVTLPGGWTSGEGTDTLMPDVNGDAVPDFAVGSSLQPGAVLVYW